MTCPRCGATFSVRSTVSSQSGGFQTGRKTDDLLVYLIHLTEHLVEATPEGESG